MPTITTRILYERQLPSGVKISAVGTKSLDANMQLSKNFKLYELANNLSGDVVKAIINNDVIKHIEMLQEFRTKLGMPCNVNSWYRTLSFNKKCGGASNSLHLQALATDLSFPKLGDALYKQIETLWRQVCSEGGTVGGINRYTNGVHLSSREDLFGYRTFITRDYRKKTGDW